MKRFALMLMLFLYACSAFGDYSIDDFLKMTLDSLKIDREKDIAFVCGVGKISHEGAIGIYLARRAAISDAQRGLLILKRSLEENAPPRIDNVYGHVPSLTLKAESWHDGLYFVEAEVKLSELMRDNDSADNYDEENEYEENNDEEEYFL